MLLKPLAGASVVDFASSMYRWYVSLSKLVNYVRDNGGSVNHLYCLSEGRVVGSSVVVYA